MLISLNWIRDYVDLPDDLDPIALAEKFTRSTAEVDGVNRVEVAAKGLIAAGIKNLMPLPGAKNLRLVNLDIGGGKTVETVSMAPVLNVGDCVVYAPPGASLKSLGAIGTTTITGKTSKGMILAADSIGIDAAGQEAVFLSDEYKPGDPLPAELFDDWLIEIDNKSLTNRPDLWGHYGIAREIAAILSRELQFARPMSLPPKVVAQAEACGSLKALSVVATDQLSSNSLPEVPIVIADAAACPRYSAIVVEGVPTQPAPLWMQLRLGHVGQRPLSGLVDLTNYVMMDIAQPMHAFDAANVRCIEVDWAGDGERFKTLDGVERTLTKTDLMIKSGGKSVALAGVMGGLDTEVSAATTSLLLESANFDGATIRRTAKRLALRSQASARFEKSLDPANTVLGIQRFVRLARAMYPNMRITGRLSDGYPNRAAPVRVAVDPRHVVRTIGRDLPLDKARRVLAPLGFEVSSAGTHWTVAVPGHRATGDVSIEADVIEELARCIGYDAVVPDLPHVSVRTFTMNALHELEQRSIEYFTTVHAFNEIHGYLWYDSAWLAKLGVDPGACVELRNPAGEGLHRLRRSLLPGLLAAVAKNRFHFDTLSLLELGSVFEIASVESPSRRAANFSPLAASPLSKGGSRGVVSRAADFSSCDPSVREPDANAGMPDRESRCFALVVAARGKRIDDELNARLRSHLSGWSWQRFGRSLGFAESAPAPDRPWEHAHHTADMMIDDAPVGRISVIDVALRRAMDEHLAAWGIAWAELRLSGLESVPRAVENLGAVPPFPIVEMDFSILVPKTTRYAEVALQLARFAHPLLRDVRFAMSYEGESVPPDRRSLTFRCTLADDTRTLADPDSAAFRSAFEGHLAECGFEIRKV
jgi:phenylalanyl-tRNA synthetase beta chain